MARYAVARLQEIEELNDGRCPYRPVRHHFGITAFGATTWTARDAGDRLLNEHDEQDEADELYVVLSGRARFEIGGEVVEAEQGTFVSVPSGMMRTAFAEEAGTTILAVSGGHAGQPYRPVGWELWAPLRKLAQDGRHEELVERAQSLIDAESPYPELLYNVACSESRLGRVDDAIAHLRQAIELMPKIRRFALEDEDLAGLRDEPAFAELTAG